MPHLGLPELVIIAFIVLLLFGAKRLPEAGAGLGRAIRSFKDGLSAPDKDAESSSSERKPAAGR